MVLASGSPRRRELLAALVPEFEVSVPSIDEDALTVDDPVQTAEDLASAKALAIAQLRQDALVIAADTVVAVREGGRWTQLAKPTDGDDAARMLGLLSGRSHLVVTGVCLRSPDGGAVFSEESTVVFRDLSEHEICEYVRSGEPMDKAGAYAIQGGASEFVEILGGSLTNVIGLPMEALELALTRFS